MDDVDIVSIFILLRKYADLFPPFKPDLRVAVLMGADYGEVMRTTCCGDKYLFVHDTHIGWALVGLVGCESGEPCNVKAFY